MCLRRERPVRRACAAWIAIAHSLALKGDLRPSGPDRSALQRRGFDDDDARSRIAPPYSSRIGRIAQSSFKRFWSQSAVCDLRRRIRGAPVWRFGGAVSKETKRLGGAARSAKCSHEPITRRAERAQASRSRRGARGVPYLPLLASVSAPPDEDKHVPRESLAHRTAADPKTCAAVFPSAGCSQCCGAAADRLRAPFRPAARVAASQTTTETRPCRPEACPAARVTESGPI